MMTQKEESSIGAFIKKRLREMNLNQATFCKNITLDQSIFSRIIRGTLKINNYVNSIAVGLKVDSEQLLRMKTLPRPKSMTTRDPAYLDQSGLLFKVKHQKLAYTQGAGIIITSLDFWGGPSIGIGTKIKLKKRFFRIPAGSQGIIIRICELVGHEGTNFEHHVFLRVRDIDSEKIYNTEVDSVEYLDDVYDYEP
jgi:hypothetical protein